MRDQELIGRHFKEIWIHGRVERIETYYATGLQSLLRSAGTIT